MTCIDEVLSAYQPHQVHISDDEGVGDSKNVTFIYALDVADSPREHQQIYSLRKLQIMHLQHFSCQLPCLFVAASQC
jgi:hypothetical protein